MKIKKQSHGSKCCGDHSGHNGLGCCSEGKSFNKSKSIKKAMNKAKDGNKPRLHYGSVNFTASNPSYKKAK